MVDEGGLARGLGAEDLDDASARDAADAEGDVEGERPGRQALDVGRGMVAHAHDAALAVLALDLGDRCFERFVLVHGGCSSLRMR